MTPRPPVRTATRPRALSGPGALARRAAATAAGVGVLLLTGCDADVRTSIEVTGTDEATVHVSAVFTDEAADQIQDDKATRTELLGIFSDRTGRDPQVDESDDRFEVSDDLTYEQLTSVSDLVGVSDVSLTADGGDATLTAHLVPPTKLAAAVESANASQPDAAALTATMLKSTHVTVEVTFPGGVKKVDGVDADVDGDTVTYERAADSTEDVMMVVAGDPTPNRWPYYVGGAGVVAIVGALLMRRRRAGP